MSTVKRNVVANVAGKAWSALLTLAVVPVYLHTLGIEAYGLIGFFVSLLAVLSLLDLGFGMALNRQLARYSVEPGREQAMRDLVRTLEVIYWLVGIAIGIAVGLLAPWIAGHWLQLHELSVQDAGQTLTLMGIAMACQWPRALYAGGLVGLQRLVVLNATSVAFTTMLNIGAVIVLWRIAPTLQALMTWYIAAWLLETVTTGAILWKLLPHAAARPRFSRKVLVQIWRFAAGMTGISATSVVLTQLDKVILSRLLALEAYGYYALAWRVASGLYYLVAPITAAFFPRFAQLAALDDQDELARLYHRSSQLLSVVLLPLVAIVVFFPRELLLLWIRDANAASNAGLLLAVLVVGTALNGLMNLPLATQLAHGATRLVFLANTVAVFTLAPLIYYMAVSYGALGAAFVWCALNVGYVLILLRLMHRRILPRELRPWLLTDVGMPLVCAFAAAFAFKYVLPNPQTEGALLGYLFAAWCVATVAALLAHHLSRTTDRPVA